MTFVSIERSRELETLRKQIHVVVNDYAARCAEQAALILREVFPTAGQVVLGLREHFDRVGSVWLLAVHDHAGEQLWVLPYWAQKLRETGEPAGPDGPAAVLVERYGEDAQEKFGDLHNEVTSLFERAMDYGVPDVFGWTPTDPGNTTDLDPHLVVLPPVSADADTA